MWQEIAAFSVVGATIALMVVRWVWNKRAGKSGGCSACSAHSRCAVAHDLIPAKSLDSSPPRKNP